MVGGIQFKSMLSNPSGIWVRVREINYLIEKGIIHIDESALNKYADCPDPEYNAIMMKSASEDHVRDMLGRELNEVDRLFIEAGKELPPKEVLDAADKADMIVNGYAFFRMEDGLINIVDLNHLDSVMVVKRGGEIVRTNMDPIEQQIVLKYFHRNLQFIANDAGEDNDGLYP